MFRGDHSSDTDALKSASLLWQTLFVKWSYIKCGDIVSHTLDILT